jgi:hypothetical protein
VRDEGGKVRKLRTRAMDMFRAQCVAWSVVIVEIHRYVLLLSGIW